MKIAVIGTGIAGNVAAYLLSPEHELTVFEHNDYVGGHTNTIRVEAGSGAHEIDTGFIVYNEERYPNFVKLLRKLGVASQPSTMSFSVRVEDGGLEYSNRSLFARRRNVLFPNFWRLLLDIRRFKTTMRELLASPESDVLLGAWLDDHRFSRPFVEHFLYPMGAAIWSADPERMATFPARFFAQFFDNHRFLDVFGQPEWRVVRGGSKNYVQKLTEGFRDRIRTKTPVTAIARAPDGVFVTPSGGPPERFDEVVVAVHGDDALALLTDPTPDERSILGSFRFQDNVAVLHSDTRLMPRRRRAWAAWNAWVPPQARGRVTLTYNMNLLQNLSCREPYLVTLNRAEEIDPTKLIRSIHYRHPIYSRAAVHAQSRHGVISGRNRTHYCGAYWGFGFHEDGVASALTVGKHFGKEL